MTRPDDAHLSPEQLKIVYNHADRVLREAGAIGASPTPINAILAAARVTVVDNEVIDEGLLRRFLAKARTGAAALKTALSKILGLFEPQDRLVVIDKDLPKARRTFILLHEAGHGMPHQAAMYSLMQDCDQLLDPDVVDLFERKANTFASEVLFQGEQFAKEAYDDPTSIDVAMRLAKRFGAGQYSTFRRYTRTSPRACALVVLDPVASGQMRSATVRRIIVSRSFDVMFDLQGQVPELVEYPHPLAQAAIPQGKRRIVKNVSWRCIDRNGTTRIVEMESFFTTHNILVLVIDRGAAQIYA